MVFNLPSLVAQSSVRCCRGRGVIRVRDTALEDCEPRLLEFPRPSPRRLAGKSRPGRLSMADSIFHAVFSSLRADLARTMDAECLAQSCHHDFAVAHDVLSSVEARISSPGHVLPYARSRFCPATP